MQERRPLKVLGHQSGRQSGQLQSHRYHGGGTCFVCLCGSASAPRPASLSPGAQTSYTGNEVKRRLRTPKEQWRHRLRVWGFSSVQWRKWVLQAQVMLQV